MRRWAATSRVQRHPSAVAKTCFVAHIPGCYELGTLPKLAALWRDVAVAVTYPTMIEATYKRWVLFIATWRRCMYDDVYKLWTCTVRWSGKLIGLGRALSVPNGLNAAWSSPFLSSLVLRRNIAVQGHIFVVEFWWPPSQYNGSWAWLSSPSGVASRLSAHRRGMIMRMIRSMSLTKTPRIVFLL